jgi:hypothetical protein
LHPDLAPTFAAALALAGVYLLGGRGRVASLAGPDRGVRLASAAAGASVAYVFVDVLPELAMWHDRLLAAGEAALPYAEERAYLMALAGFLVFYGLEHMVLAARAGGRSGAGADAGDRVYRLHLLGFALYCWLVGYLLVDRAARGTVALVFYTIALGLHGIMVDHSLRHEHGRAYERVGHWVLAAAVLGGCLAAVALPVPDRWMARIFAFVAGGVVITSVRSELPGERKARFGAFLVGAAAFAGLLVLA